MKRDVLNGVALAASVLVAYWGVTSWLPAFLATPVEQGGAGLTVTKSCGFRWVVRPWTKLHSMMWSAR